MSSKKNIILASIVWIAICLIISGVSGWITAHNVDTWYPHINKPSFNPPNWVFAPVWTILYIMIGLSGAHLWRKRHAYPLPFIIYLVQLIFNFAWSFIFFGAHMIGWALVDIILLWLTLSITIVTSYKASQVASYLLIPYFLWLSFATILNASLWYLN